MADALNIDVVRAFWARKAEEPSNRWTGSEMLDFEADLLSAISPLGSILDLGSGHGDLSRRLAGTDRRLVAVDWEPGFAAAFSSPNHEFHVCSVTSLFISEQFDLVLLFGVVTSLDLEQEERTYGLLASVVRTDGTAVVKNQCSKGSEFAVDKWSDELGARYSGRYPAQADQRLRLERHFASVEVVEYPSAMNRWPNSRHVAFICRSPLVKRESE